MQLTTIGNYDVIREIATGGRGEVFLARRRAPNADGRHVVLERFHAQFLDEVKIATDLSHPNIAQIYELFEDGENGYVIAMEYVRGSTVLSILREYARGHIGGLPFGIVTRITGAICEALHYAYFEPGPDGAARNVVHGDISPSNVMIGYDGQIKLVDFGIANALQHGYTSPEQIKSQPLDHRTDIFSLGTMMWEMLVGKRLFKRDTDMQMLYAILEEDIPKPSARNDKIPPAVDDVVMRALARQREDRYQDARELARDLNVIAKNNDWDVEAATLSRFLRELIPEELAVSAAATDVQGDDAPRVEIVQPRPANSGNGMVIAILVLVLISSVFFWVAIAPNL